MGIGKVWMGVVVMAVAVAAPAMASSRQDTVHAVIPLKHVPAMRAQKLIASGTMRSNQQKPEPLKIAGMDYIAVDTVRGAVLAVGTEKAIKELREIVALLDVPIPALVVDLRILQSVQQEDGTLKTEVVTTPTVKTLNDEEASVSIGDNRSQITAVVRPRLNGDDTVTVTAEMRVHYGDQAGAYHRLVKRIKLNQAALTTWIPDIVVGEHARPGLIGITTTQPNQQPGYYLEVTVRNQTPGP